MNSELDFRELIFHIQWEEKYLWFTIILFLLCLLLKEMHGKAQGTVYLLINTGN